MTEGCQLFINQNTSCGFSKELSCQYIYFEHLQHKLFLLLGDKLFFLFLNISLTGTMSSKPIQMSWKERLMNKYD